MTRGLVFTAHGHLLDAVRHHPLAPGVAACLLLAPTGLFRRSWPRAVVWAAHAVAVGALLVAWAVRLAGWWPLPG
jgi:hypothetical protein